MTRIWMTSARRRRAPSSDIARFTGTCSDRADCRVDVDRVFRNVRRHPAIDFGYPSVEPCSVGQNSIRLIEADLRDDPEMTMEAYRNSADARLRRPGDIAGTVVGRNLVWTTRRNLDRTSQVRSCRRRAR